MREVSTLSSWVITALQVLTLALVLPYVTLQIRSAETPFNGEFLLMRIQCLPNWCLLYQCYKALELQSLSSLYLCISNAQEKVHCNMTGCNSIG